MTPRYFAKAVIPHGTTTIITDPHEIGNVMGVEGVKYMHECISSQDARDRIRVGINVDARESSISQDIDDIIRGVKDFRYCDRITFATDDTESDIKGIGAIAPGYAADILLMDNLEGMKPKAVFYGGQLVASKGFMTDFGMIDAITQEFVPMFDKN